IYSTFLSGLLFAVGLWFSFIGAGLRGFCGAGMACARDKIKNEFDRKMKLHYGFLESMEADISVNEERGYEEQYYSGVKGEKGGYTKVAGGTFLLKGGLDGPSNAIQQNIVVNMSGEKEEYTPEGETTSKPVYIDQTSFSQEGRLIDTAAFVNDAVVKDINDNVKAAYYGNLAGGEAGSASLQQLLDAYLDGQEDNNLRKQLRGDLRDAYDEGYEEAYDKAYKETYDKYMSEAQQGSEEDTEESKEQAEETKKQAILVATQAGQAAGKAAGISMLKAAIIKKSIEAQLQGITIEKLLKGDLKDIYVASYVAAYKQGVKAAEEKGFLRSRPTTDINWFTQISQTKIVGENGEITNSGNPRFLHYAPSNIRGEEREKLDETLNSDSYYEGEGNVSGPSSPAKEAYEKLVVDSLAIERGLASVGPASKPKYDYEVFVLGKGKEIVRDSSGNFNISHENDTKLVLQGGRSVASASVETSEAPKNLVRRGGAAYGATTVTSDVLATAWMRYGFKMDGENDPFVFAPREKGGYLLDSTGETDSRFDGRFGMYIAEERDIASENNLDVFYRSLLSDIFSGPILDNGSLKNFYQTALDNGSHKNLYEAAVYYAPSYDRAEDNGIIATTDVGETAAKKLVENGWAIETNSKVKLVANLEDAEITAKMAEVLGDAYAGLLSTLSKEASEDEEGV
ncbi:MAG TPA: hypothetical protein PLA72_11030, partial [Smithellaceae bacterium]|nr:hypothetical protein [Smithellaceae bacterium]